MRRRLSLTNTSNTRNHNSNNNEIPKDSQKPLVSLGSSDDSGDDGGVSKINKSPGKKWGRLRRTSRQKQEKKKKRSYLIKRKDMPETLERVHSVKQSLERALAAPDSSFVIRENQTATKATTTSSTAATEGSGPTPSSATTTTRTKGPPPTATKDEAGPDTPSKKKRGIFGRRGSKKDGDHQVSRKEKKERKAMEKKAKKEAKKVKKATQKAIQKSTPPPRERESSWCSLEEDDSEEAYEEERGEEGGEDGGDTDTTCTGGPSYATPATATTCPCGESDPSLFSSLSAGSNNPNPSSYGCAQFSPSFLRALPSMSSGPPASSMVPYSAYTAAIQEDKDALDEWASSSEDENDDDGNNNKKPAKNTKDDNNDDEEGSVTSDAPTPRISQRKKPSEKFVQPDDGDDIDNGAAVRAVDGPSLPDRTSNNNSKPLEQLLPSKDSIVDDEPSLDGIGSINTSGTNTDISSIASSIVTIDKQEVSAEQGVQEEPPSYIGEASDTSSMRTSLTRTSSSSTNRKTRTTRTRQGSRSNSDGSSHKRTKKNVPGKPNDATKKQKSKSLDSHMEEGRRRSRRRNDSGGSVATKSLDSSVGSRSRASTKSSGRSRRKDVSKREPQRSSGSLSPKRKPSPGQAAPAPASKGTSSKRRGVLPSPRRGISRHVSMGAASLSTDRPQRRGRRAQYCNDEGNKSTGALLPSTVPISTLAPAPSFHSHQGSQSGKGNNSVSSQTRRRSSRGRGNTPFESSRSRSPSSTNRVASAAASANTTTTTASIKASVADALHHSPKNVQQQQQQQQNQRAGGPGNSAPVPPVGSPAHHRPNQNRTMQRSRSAHQMVGDAPRRRTQQRRLSAGFDSSTDMFRLKRNETMAATTDNEEGVPQPRVPIRGRLSRRSSIACCQSTSSSDLSTPFSKQQVLNALGLTAKSPRSSNWRQRKSLTQPRQEQQQQEQAQQHRQQRRLSRRHSLQNVKNNKEHSNSGRGASVGRRHQHRNHPQSDPSCKVSAMSSSVESIPNVLEERTSARTVDVVDTKQSYHSASTGAVPVTPVDVTASSDHTTSASSSTSEDVDSQGQKEPSWRSLSLEDLMGPKTEDESKKVENDNNKVQSTSNDDDDDVVGDKTDGDRRGSENSIDVNLLIGHMQVLQSLEKLTHIKASQSVLGIGESGDGDDDDGRSSGLSSYLPDVHRRQPQNLTKIPSSSSSSTSNDPTTTSTTTDMQDQRCIQARVDLLAALHDNSMDVFQSHYGLADGDILTIELHADLCDHLKEEISWELIYQILFPQSQLFTKKATWDPLKSSCQILVSSSSSSSLTLSVSSA